MPKMVLTDLAISKLKSPEAPKQADYWDTSDQNLHGFGLRVSYNGTKTFVLMVSLAIGGDRKLTRVTLGRYDQKGKHGLSLKAARDMARDYRDAAKDGHDPRKERQERERELIEQSKDTFAAVRDRFVALHCQQKKQSTAREYERLLTVNCSRWNDVPLAKITKKNVSALLDEYLAEGKPYKVNRTFSILRKFFSWAVSRDIIAKSPMDGLTPDGKEAARDRVLTESEIKVLWRVFDKEGLFTPAYKLLLLTGQRLGEVVGMRRSELKDLHRAEADSGDPRWEIPGSRTKNKNPHTVPLSPLAVEIIKSIPNRGDLLFTTNGKTPISGFSKAKARLDKHTNGVVEADGLEDEFREEWRVHDFRRTVVTHLAELGVRDAVIEAIVNHVSGLRAGVAGTYNRAKLMADRRKALNMWAEHLQKLTASGAAEEVRRAA
jgi:integrase